MRNIMVTGTVTGTGAAINVSIGFIPRKVKVYNPNNTTVFPTVEWVRGMPNGRGFKTLRIVDSGTTGLGSSTYLTSNGISEFAGTQTASAGFTIGADTDLNRNGEVMVYEAFR